MLGSMGEPNDEPCCFDEWALANRKRARTKEAAAPVTRALLAALERTGLENRTVLDVGCGTGDLALSTLAHGATRATGIDLGRGAIENAQELAGERGLADRVSFSVGDGSTASLARHDVVALNRVVCCYASADALLDNALPAAGLVFALTAPVDRGPMGAVNRVLIRTANAWYRLRERKFKGFRVFVHDLGVLDRRVRNEGFVPIVTERVRATWHLAVYARAG